MPPTTPEQHKDEDAQLTELVGQDAAARLQDMLANGAMNINFEEKEAQVKAIIMEYYNNALAARFCSMMNQCIATMVFISMTTILININVNSAGADCESMGILHLCAVVF